MPLPCHCSMDFCIGGKGRKGPACYSHNENPMADKNQLYYGDNLDVLRRPMRAFHTFLGNSDMMAYLAMMAPRLIELRRMLKETGSIYLHCDPTASHYLKIQSSSANTVKFQECYIH